MIDCALNGEAIDYDWCGTLETGSVVVEELGKNAAEGTAEKLAEVTAELKSGERHVFDCDTFTVDNKKLETYKVEGDIEVVKDGYFHESDISLYRSAPYFDLLIDGITAYTDEN